MQSQATLSLEVPATAVEAPRRVSLSLTRWRPTLAAQFLIANLIVLLAGMGVIGAWVGGQIEAGVPGPSTAASAFFVDSVISPRLQVLASKTPLDENDIAQIDWLMDA